MDDQEFKRKYQGHWYLNTDEERFQQAINSIRFTCVIKNDDYTRGFIDACRAIEAKFKEIKESTNVK